MLRLAISRPASQSIVGLHCNTLKADSNNLKKLLAAANVVVWCCKSQCLKRNVFTVFTVDASYRQPRLITGRKII